MLDLMILFVLLNRDLTMYSVKKHIALKFSPFADPSFGAIKPALVRLEKSKCITSSKVMSDGGKLSVFYSITKDGMKELKKLLLKSFSKNPQQFISDARIKLCCASFLSKDEFENLLYEIKNCAYMHKNNTENLMNDNYNKPDFYQRIVLDNTICEYKNFISMLEGFEK